MQKDMISVIVPCFNLDQYLKRCMDSILGQTYRNLEVIAIDDGSADSTPEILAQYAKEDPRVVFLRQENAGAGAAANAAVQLARGEYLAFVDNDDWIEPEMYEKLHTAMLQNGADMAVCNYNLTYSDHVDACRSSMREEAVDVQDDVFAYFCRYCACPRPNNYIWTRLYKTELVKESGIRFEAFRMGADTLFNFKLLPLLRRVSFIPEGLYNYVQRPDSSVYTVARRLNIAEAYADGFDSLADYYHEHGYSSYYSVLQIHAFTRLRSVFFYSRLAGLEEQEIKANIERAFAGRRITDYLTGRLP